MADDIVVRTDFPHTVKVIEHQTIVMPDGCELSARIWLPEDADQNPIPVILEHLPYRKRDGTIVRDCMNHPWFAGHGYACVRVDMRGNGDSQGVMEDEYTTQELQDACDVIQWATEQTWCSGTAGMMGISWGGFNALQVASLKPSALKAIVTVCSTVDRFADDIHYKGGCLLGENAGWAANMLSYSSRPPDPLLVGEQWRDLWMQRLDNMPFLATTWLQHQRRDEYWKHGSVCEDYGQIEAAVLSMGGWHDGYKNTISHLVQNLDSPVKGIVGPWIHKYPNYAGPAPRIGFLQECLTWWDKWLKNKDNGADQLPAYRAYIMDGLAPAPWYDERPGRWIAEHSWPSDAISDRYFEINTDNTSALRQVDNPSIDSESGWQLNISSPPHCGSQTGEYFPFTFGPELPDQQNIDDELSTCFDTAPCTGAIDIVGAPSLSIRCTVDKPLAQLVVRLCDIMPDGRSSLITFGMLNLTHAGSREHPERLDKARVVIADVILDQIAYRLPKGHKLRVSLSTSYWPFIWPSPETTTVSLSNLSLAIPERTSQGHTDECSFKPPETASAWHHEVVRESSSSRQRYLDEKSGQYKTTVFNDFGENKDLDHGLITGSTVSEIFSIHPDSPLSAQVDIEWEQTLKRDDWNIRTIAQLSMTADLEWFYLTGSLQAWEGEDSVFNKQYDEKVRREFV